VSVASQYRDNVLRRIASKCHAMLLHVVSLGDTAIITDIFGVTFAALHRHHCILFHNKGCRLGNLLFDACLAGLD